MASGIKIDSVKMSIGFPNYDKYSKKQIETGNFGAAPKARQGQGRLVT